MKEDKKDFIQWLTEDGLPQTKAILEELKAINAKRELEEKKHSFTGKEKAMFEAVKEALSELTGLADGFENDYVEYKQWYEKNVI